MNIVISISSISGYHARTTRVQLIQAETGLRALMEDAHVRWRGARGAKLAANVSICDGSGSAALAQTAPGQRGGEGLGGL